MCYDAHQSITAFTIMMMCTIYTLLSNTSLKYLTGFTFFIALIQLWEYQWFMKKSTSHITGMKIYTTLLLQNIALYIGLFLYANSIHISHIALNLYLLLSSVVYVVLIVKTYYNSTFTVNHVNGHVAWSNNGGNIFPYNEGFLYVSGMLWGLIGMTALMYSSNDSQVTTMAILLLIGLLSYMYVGKVVPEINFASMWCYTAIIFIFTMTLFAFAERVSI